MRVVVLPLLVIAAAACAGKRTAPAPPPSAVTSNRPPIVRARCEPCSVTAGQRATVRVEAEDPDGDALTYRWSTPAGTLATPSAARTAWTAPAIEGPVFLSVRVEDGKGGSSSDVITVTVTK